MIYVASPYSHDKPEIQEHRFRIAERYVVAAFNQKLAAFSPIVYCHELAKRYNLPGDAVFWKSFNNQMMRRSEEVHVLKIIGWEKSRGVQYELFMANELGIRIIEVTFTDENFPAGFEP